MPLQLKEEKEFRFDIEDLKSLITPKTKMIIINSPQNPTGGILTQDDLKAIAELAVKHDILVLADEIYGRVVYDGFKNYTIAAYPGMRVRTIILDGFSKTYAMTGWRLGFGIMPAELAAIVAKLQTNVGSCTASFIQIAGIEALRGPQHWVDNVVEEFKTRRDLIVDGVNSIPGFKCHKPLGAFYVFPNITATGIDSRTLAKRILDEAAVKADHEIIVAVIASDLLLCLIAGIEVLSQDGHLVLVELEFQLLGVRIREDRYTLDRAKHRVLRDRHLLVVLARDNSLVVRIAFIDQA